VPDNIIAFTNNTFLTSILIRSSSRLDHTKDLQNIIHTARPDLPIASIRPFREVVRQSLAEPRFIALLTAAFSGLALLLTAVGNQSGMLCNPNRHLRCFPGQETAGKPALQPAKRFAGHDHCNWGAARFSCYLDQPANSHSGRIY
jgi:hypothetical protein